MCNNKDAINLILITSVIKQYLICVVYVSDQKKLRKLRNRENEPKSDL